MAAMAGPGMGPGPGPGPVLELVAELRDRDGQARSVRVPYPAAERGEAAAELRGVRRALCELQERVVELLAPLVRQELRERGGGGAGDEEDGEEEEDEEEDEGEEENHVEAAAGGGDPPPKRSKVQRP